MKKRKKTSITKEVVILILLLILIMLIFAVALYDFIPSNIGVSDEISYSSDSKTTTIKQEIAYTNSGDLTADDDEIFGGDIDASMDSESDSELITALKSYSIEASDLAVYGQKNLYNSGNSNPFDYSEETAGTAEGATDANGNPVAGGTGSEITAGTENGGSSTTAGGQGSSTSTPGTFFENPKSK